MCAMKRALPITPSQEDVLEEVVLNIANVLGEVLSHVTPEKQGMFILFYIYCFIYCSPYF